jgi:hypothetical protein
MTSSKVCLVLLLIVLSAGCGGGGGGGSSSSGVAPPENGGGTTTPAEANVLSVTVNGALCSTNSFLNKACIAVTICEPGTSTCQTVNDILLDTASYGLRIFRQSLSISLPGTIIGSGSLAECIQFGDGSSVWGPHTGHRLHVRNLACRLSECRTVSCNSRIQRDSGSRFLCRGLRFRLRNYPEQRHLLRMRPVRKLYKHHGLPGRPGAESGLGSS